MGEIFFIFLCFLLLSKQEIYHISQTLEIESMISNKRIRMTNDSQKLMFNEERQMLIVSNTRIDLFREDKRKIADHLKKIEADLAILESSYYFPKSKPGKTQLGKLMRCLSKNILLSERGYDFE
ncbi:hypothetical protein F6X86_13335 [Enterococcus durans]|uniref:Uncharacterized protein n=2 Tax=Enterococcus durans TaxID=53345 RepID=A0A5N0YN00_9ENTE|nr:MULTISPECIES: hypothetical protein [Enterococcus]KAA9176792.1 hypothetical protein F6X86_13335 [Enterococcus durans]KAA9182514.1 hypothetical protein F6X85_13445 [Enterococcus durans]KAA9183643.1 hypothetical protein F6X90_13590 [Enterococcus durans]KAA9188278.1 hypothetical protein F6Y12_13220 [Enterococcus durans]KAA9190449.1 hypothetical protein F6X88_13135 [Enterococcus durans]